jgi:superfamily I DNA/RNA helicase
VYVAPKRPSVIFADEAQDLNRMQLTLIRKWGERASYFIVAADDDQTIYSFTGATPEAVLDPDIPADHKIILKQSYRVPRAVHGPAMRLIKQVTRRQEKDYLPRPAEGECIRLSSGTYKSPEYFILKTAIQHLERGQTVMFLAACGYMLQPLVAVLRKNAIPFHNPYRKSNGFWNPLRMGRGSTPSRILALLVAHPGFGNGRRDWTNGDLGLWAEWLTAEGVLKRGAKKKLQNYPPNDTATIETLDDLFETAALEALLTAFAGDYRSLLEWWRKRVTASVFKRVQFPLDIADAHGPTALIEVPRVIVGTIHSVKGGEADVVYLFPDLSGEADRQYQKTGPPRDAVIRQFYVGMTRARETLYICPMETGMAVRL